MSPRERCRQAAIEHYGDLNLYVTNVINPLNKAVVSKNKVDFAKIFNNIGRPKIEVDIILTLLDKLEGNVSAIEFLQNREYSASSYIEALALDGHYGDLNTSQRKTYSPEIARGLAEGRHFETLNKLLENSTDREDYELAAEGLESADQDTLSQCLSFISNESVRETLVGEIKITGNCPYDMGKISERADTIRLERTAMNHGSNKEFKEQTFPQETESQVPENLENDVKRDTIDINSNKGLFGLAKQMFKGIFSSERKQQQDTAPEHIEDFQNKL